MEQLSKKEFYNMINTVLSNESIKMTVDRGDKSIADCKEPSKFLHYEIDEKDGEMTPVEHSSAETVPVTDRSVIVAVWKQDKSVYERYYDSTKFKELYR